MTLSVIICTYNRTKDLCRILDSLAAGWSRDTDAEVLVVDNSADGNSIGALGAYEHALPLRGTHEPRTGLSRARNAGVRESRGDWCVFTDDDCRAPGEWIPQWLTAIDRHPEAGFMGGPIRAVFEKKRPAWVDLENYGFLFGHLELAQAEGPYPSEVYPWGGNMGFRRSVSEDTGGFDPAFGMSGENMLSGEETVFFYRAVKAGHRGVYVPDLATNHMIPHGRATLRYVWRRSLGQGRTMAMGIDVPPDRRPARNATWGRFSGHIKAAARNWLRRPGAATFGRLYIQCALAAGHYAGLRERGRPREA